MALTQSDIKLLLAWHEAKRLADEAKLVIEKEQELRGEVVKQLFNPNEPGTKTIPLWEGWELKCVVPKTTSIDEAEFKNAEVELPKYGVDTTKLVKVKVTPDVTAINTLLTNPKLSSQVKGLIESILITKTGKGTLALVRSEE